MNLNYIVQLIIQNFPKSNIFVGFRDLNYADYTVAGVQILICIVGFKRSFQPSI